MPGATDGPLGPLPNMFWDPVRAKYFPNPRQSTAVPNQPRQEQPSKRPPSPSKKVETGERSTKLDASGRDGQPAQGSSMAKGPRQKLNAFRRLGGIGRVTLGSPLLASNHDDRMRGYVFNLGVEEIEIEADSQNRSGPLDQPQASSRR